MGLGPMSGTERGGQAGHGQGGPYTASYRVSDYFASHRAVRHELRLRQLRHPADVYLVFGVSRSLLRVQLSRLRVPSRPLRRRPLAARVRRTGYVYGQPTSADSYRTFPVVQGTGLTADQIAPPPSIGVYAPALGPGIGLYGR